jgi:CDP-glucose 4,6-dehydratase
MRSALDQGRAWSSYRVLVTGADGFVGRWMVDALACRGAKVIALAWAGNSAKVGPKSLNFSHASVEFLTGDVTDLAAMSGLISEQQVDLVYHLAANNVNTGTGISPYAVYETNIRGVYTILEAGRLARKPPGIVVASSREVEDCFSTEARRRMHPYMTSKAAAELITRAYGDTFGVACALVRSDNLYGGGDLNWSRLVPYTVRAILRDEIPVIRSDGQLRRDYVYIEDAVAAYLAIGQRLYNSAVRNQLFRITTGSTTSVIEMVQLIAQIAGKPELEPTVLNERREERLDRPYQPDLEQIVLGWRNQNTLTAGLAQTIEWYRDYLNQLPENDQQSPS